MRGWKPSALTLRGYLLRQWLASGEVLDKCELSLEMTKEVENMYEREDQLLTIEGMRKAGVTETLDMYCVHTFLFTFCC